MVNTLYSLPGYIHLYRSLLRFCDMPENEIKEMLYQLNAVNLDCFANYHPDFHVYESGPVRFSMKLDRLDRRPYRTEVQLYKSLLAECGDARMSRKIYHIRDIGLRLLP